MAPQITRLFELTAAAAATLASTFNGIPAGDIHARIVAGELALLEADMGSSRAYAIVSRQGELARIEALAGAGGMYLARRIVETAHANGLSCDAWVKSRALARLTSRIGARATGERFGTQLRVLA